MIRSSTKEVDVAESDVSLSGSSQARNQNETLVRQMQGRRVGPAQQFFANHLKPGMRLLDCGCGPGALTLGFAALVRPGETVGIDIDPQVIERAVSAAGESMADNVRFEVGDIHRLPYPDASFDAVWAQLVLFHVPDPLAVLKEMRRVIRPGGFIGIRDADTASEYMVPSTPLTEEAEALILRVRQFTGGSPFYGRQQRKLLLDAGFSKTEQSAGASTAGSDEELTRWVTYLDSRFRSYAKTGVEQGWIDEAHVDEIAGELRQWCQRPDAFFFHVDLSAIGFVDP